MEGKRIRHCHLLTPPRNAGSTVPESRTAPSSQSRLCMAACESSSKSQQQTTPPHTLGSSVAHTFPTSCTHNISSLPSSCLGKAWHFPGLPDKGSQPSSPAGRSRTTAFRCLLSSHTLSVPHYPTLGPYPLQTTPHSAPPQPLVSREDVLIALKQHKGRERKREWPSVQPLHGTEGESTA